jgi:hypothetical protein
MQVSSASLGRASALARTQGSSTSARVASWLLSSRASGLALRGIFGVERRDHHRTRAPKGSVPPIEPLPSPEELIAADGPDDLDSDDEEDDAASALSSVEQQAVTKQLMAIENHVYSAVNKSAYLATDIMPPALGAAWYKMPRCQVTAALPRAWRMFAGKGRLLTLPYAQVISVPPGALPIVKKKKTDEDYAAEEGADEVDVARSPVSLTVSRFPKALNAPIIKSLQRTNADLARFLMSFLVVKHGPSGLVTQEGMDEGVADASYETTPQTVAAAQKKHGGSSAGTQFDAFNPNVSILASWNTEGPSPSAETPDDKSMQVFGLEFAVPVSVEDAGLKTKEGNNSPSGSSASETISLRFNSTLLLDRVTGDITEVTFRCPDELWDMAWEGLDPDDYAPSRYLNRPASLGDDDDESIEEDEELAKERKKEEESKRLGRRTFRQRQQEEEAKKKAEEEKEEIKAFKHLGRKVRRGAASSTSMPIRGKVGGPPIPPVLEGFECISAKRILDAATVTPPWES